MAPISKKLSKKLTALAQAPKASQIAIKRQLGLFIGNLKPPSTLFIGCEGHKLSSRDGILSLISMFQRRDGPAYADPKRARNSNPEPSQIISHATIYVLNMHKLGSRAWEPADAAGTRRSLRSILHGAEHTKVFWDVDRAAAALWGLHGIKIGGPVVDLQLMERTASRSAPSEHPLTLEEVVMRDAGLSHERKTEWAMTDLTGGDMVDPQTGGSPDVYQAERLPKEMVNYAANRVRDLPALYEHYRAAMTDKMFERVLERSLKRVQQAVETAGTPREDVVELERQRVRAAERRLKGIKREEKILKRKKKREEKAAMEEKEKLKESREKWERVERWKETLQGGGDITDDWRRTEFEDMERQLWEEMSQEEMSQEDEGEDEEDMDYEEDDDYEEDEDEEDERPGVGSRRGAMAERRSNTRAPSTRTMTTTLRHHRRQEARAARFKRGAVGTGREQRSRDLDRGEGRLGFSGRQQDARWGQDTREQDSRRGDDARWEQDNRRGQDSRRTQDTRRAPRGTKAPTESDWSKLIQELNRGQEDDSVQNRGKAAGQERKSATKHLDMQAMRDFARISGQFGGR